jgi:S1-C subfamily serine protease
MRADRRSFCLTLWTLVVALGFAPLWAAETGSFRAALSSITAEEAGRHVDVLADDAFEGREAGSRGGRAAGGYLVEYLRASGVAPAGEDGGYYQSFEPGYRNVLAIIPGRDPELRDEYIALGAHYDHVGYGQPQNSFGPIGRIHNGADDNASGTAGLMEVIQAFTMLPQPPRRSLLFAFWDGEEQGLLGSKHWIAHPTAPVERIRMKFNLDMIGRLRDNRLEVYGARSAHGLRTLISRHNSDFGLELDFPWEAEPNSDHYPFFERGVPFLMLHTGLHDQYHRPTDEAQLINRDGIQLVAQLTFCLAHELAEADQVPDFRSAARHESKRQRAQFERELPPAPPRLGLSWSREVADSGLTVTRVASDSAAERAGFRVGDRLIEFDGQVVMDGEQFRLLVLASSSSTDARVVRPGHDGPVELLVTLPGKPVRLGFSWDEDPAEPAMVMLTRIVPGSAADRAGLAARDRVYAVAGESFAGSEDFSRLVKDRPGPIELLVERQGVLRTVTVQPVDRHAARAAVSDAVETALGG